MFIMNTKKLLILGSMLFASISLASCGKDEPQTTNIIPSATEVSIKVGSSVEVKFEHEIIEGITSEFIIGNENLISIFKDGNSVTIFGLEEGETTLTKKYNGGSATIKIIVLPKDKIHSVKLANYSKEELAVMTNQEVDLKAQYFLDETLGKDATFTYNVIDATNAIMDGSKFKASETGDYLVKITPTYGGEIKYNLIKDIKLKVMDSVSSIDYRYIGRTIERDSEIHFDNVNSGIEFAFFGTKVSATVFNRSKINQNGKVKLLIDNGDKEAEIILNSTEIYKTISIGNLDNCYHVARIVNAFEEGFIPMVKPDSVVVDNFAPLDEVEKKSMLVIGDSITAGYCAISNTAWTPENSDSTYSFAYQSSLLLDVDLECIASQGIGVRYGNRNRLGEDQYMINLYNKNSIYDLESEYENTEHDIVVVELGTNDAQFKSSYYEGQKFVFENYYFDLLNEVYEDNPNAIFVCVYGMMSNDPMIAEGIRNAANRMNDENETSNFYYSDSFVSATNGHPNASQHSENAKKLADFINQIVK